MNQFQKVNSPTKSSTCCLLLLVRILSWRSLVSTGNRFTGSPVSHLWLDRLDGLRVDGCGLNSWVSGCGVWEFRFRAWGLGSRVWGVGCRVQSLGLRVEGWGLGLRVAVGIWGFVIDGLSPWSPPGIATLAPTCRTNFIPKHLWLVNLVRGNLLHKRSLLVILK